MVDYKIKQWLGCREAVGAHAAAAGAMQRRWATLVVMYAMDWVGTYNGIPAAAAAAAAQVCAAEAPEGSR
jgi:hypothetical protein